MKLCKEKKKKAKYPLYIIRRTEHLITFKRAPEHKLCLIKQPGLLCKTSSYGNHPLYALYAHMKILCFLLGYIQLLSLHTTFK